jgi:hypothetical protein
VRQQHRFIKINLGRAAMTRFNASYYDSLDWALLRRFLRVFVDVYAGSATF